MKSYILITGASTGIGYEMALQLAQKQYNLILVARSADKLQALQKQLMQQYPIDVRMHAIDLSIPDNAIRFYQTIKSEMLPVSHLVNNAGFGDYGEFLETSMDKELEMINLNISSLMVLTKLFARDMAAVGSGRIMNVASLLAFIPLPYYSVYAATKSFVLTFSESIAAELAPYGLVVSTLCPGAVETPFHTPEMRKTNAMKANKPMPADKVAEAGVKLLLHGKGKKLVGFQNWFIAQLPRITPSSIMMKIKKNLTSQ
jgi:short-subunit dehydrogenase